MAVVNQVGQFEALDLTIAEFEALSHTIAEFEAGLDESDLVSGADSQSRLIRPLVRDLIWDCIIPVIN